MVPLNRSRESGWSPLALAIVSLVVVGLAATSNAPAGSENALASTPQIVYLEPLDTAPALRLGIAPAYLAVQRVTVVATAGQLQAAVARLGPRTIMINSAALASVPDTWLQDQFANGVTIVGVNATRRALATSLGLTGDGVPLARATVPLRAPGQGSPAEEAALDWRHPTLPTVVIYAHGQLSSAGWRVSSYNEAYDPQQPGALFLVIEQVAHQAQP